MLESTRRRRRATRFIWPIILTGAAMLAVVVAGAGRDTRAELEYLDAIHDQAMSLSAGGDSLGDVSARLFSIDRVEFVTVTESLRSHIDDGLALVGSGPPSMQLRGVNTLYRLTLEAWSRGVDGYESSILLAADEPANAEAFDGVADAMAELRAGDELYLVLVAELSGDGDVSPVAPMPEVKLRPSDGGLASVSQAYVSSARSPSNTLGLRPGIAVSQIAVDPAWVVSPDGQAVLPSTDEASFTVVVNNTGNIETLPETLRLKVTGGPEPIEVAVDIQPLQPGRLRAVKFEPLPVVPGLIYEVRAFIDAINIDVDLTDNEIAVVFLVNEGVAEG